MLVLAVPIAASFGYMVYRAIHPRERECQGVCADISPILFLVCVAVFGPALWATVRLLKRGLEANREQLVWLAAANVWVAAAIVLIALPFGAFISLSIPGAGWIVATLVVVMSLALITAVVEPATPTRY